MRGSWWIFVDVTTTVTSMAGLTRKPRSKYWFACFRDVNGRQHRKSTGDTDRKKALKVAAIPVAAPLRTHLDGENGIIQSAVDYAPDRRSLAQGQSAIRGN